MEKYGDLVFGEALQKEYVMLRHAFLLFHSICLHYQPQHSCCHLQSTSMIVAAEPGMGADLLSHEATFSVDMYGKARIAQHSTARDAGAFAARLKAKTLVLTHFSNRYSFEGSRPSVRLI